MRYKELKEKVEAWGEKYYYKATVEIKDYVVAIIVYYAGNYRIVTIIDNESKLAINTVWSFYINLQEDAKEELFKIVTEFGTLDLSRLMEDSNIYLTRMVSILLQDEMKV